MPAFFHPLRRFRRSASGSHWSVAWDDGSGIDSGKRGTVRVMLELVVAFVLASEEPDRTLLLSDVEQAEPLVLSPEVLQVEASDRITAGWVRRCGVARIADTSAASAATRPSPFPLTRLVIRDFEASDETGAGW